MKETERRFLPVDIKTNQETRTIHGYAAVFDSVADLGWFQEKIARGAFDGVDTDTVALVNHDSSMVIGRKSAGTLRLKGDDHGLLMEVDLPNTTYANDLYESIARGDIKHQSFAFQVLEDEWSNENGKDTRTIKKVRSLFDVSPVTYPAYSDTTVAKRSFEEKKSIETDGGNTVNIDLENEDLEIELILSHHGE